MIPAIDAHHHFWDPDAGDYPWMVGPVAPIRFRPRRGLMGTDWPVCLLAADYQKTVMLVRKAIAHLPEPDQRAILWDAAAEVYRLDKERL